MTMTESDYEAWVERARALTATRMADARSRFGMSGYKRYEVDLTAAEIRFYDKDSVCRLRADIRVAGSWSSASRSWMWGWENDSVPDVAVDGLSAVAEAGERLGVERLRRLFGDCDEGEAWSMASLACEILGAECVYRSPGRNNYTFLLLWNLRLLP